MQAVLAAVVRDQPVAVVLTVVLDAEPRLRVIQVGAADEPAFAVPELNLYLGSGQPAPDQKQPQTRFHRGFCLRFDQLERPPRADHTGDAPAILDVGPELVELHESRVQSHIERNHSVDEGKPARQVETGA